MIPKKLYRYRSHLLRYAGEFVIIFSSITFTWWFDEWRQERTDRASEALILRNLNANLKIDSLNLDAELSYILKVDLTFDEFLEKLKTGQLSDADSSGFLIRRLIIAPEFHPNKATFEGIKSTGELKLIEEDSLAQAIMNLYEVSYQELDFLIDVYNRTSIETIWNYAIENHDLEKVLGMPGDRIYKLNFKSDEDRRMLINKIRFTQMAVTYSTIRIQGTLEKISLVRYRIRKRLEELT